MFPKTLTTDACDHSLAQSRRESASHDAFPLVSEHYHIKIIVSTHFAATRTSPVFSEDAKCGPNESPQSASEDANQQMENVIYSIPFTLARFVAHYAITVASLDCHSCPLWQQHPLSLRPCQSMCCNSIRQHSLQPLPVLILRGLLLAA
jgi:hypothetical protein